MSPELKLMRWADRDVREWMTILDRCRCGEVSVHSRYSGGEQAVLPGIPDRYDKACSIHRHRKERRNAFGTDADLFKEPAWDILLELYISSPDGGGLAATSIAHAIEVPITTTLRWVRILTVRELVSSSADDADARIRRVRLTSRAEDAIAEYLDAL